MGAEREYSRWWICFWVLAALLSIWSIAIGNGLPLLLTGIAAGAQIVGHFFGTRRATTNLTRLYWTSVGGGIGALVAGAFHLAWFSLTISPPAGVMIMPVPILVRTMEFAAVALIGIAGGFAIGLVQLRRRRSSQDRESAAL